MQAYVGVVKLPKNLHMVNYRQSTDIMEFEEYVHDLYKRELR